MGASQGSESSARSTVAVAVVAFFVVTLDAVVVNVALPSVRQDLGGGVRGLQWVVDGYTLVFAALLLSAGALSDRMGACRAIGVGTALFVVTSAGCGLAPTLSLLVVFRLLQGAAAAAMMPASLALVRQAHEDPVRRARAVAVWAMGGAVASSSGPVVGGALSLVDWRLVFLVNVPVGVVCLVLLRRAERSPRRTTPFDPAGQVTAVLAMGGLTYGAIESGAVGLLAPEVLGAFTVASVASICFVVSQARGRHPMVPPSLVAARGVPIAMLIGFAFMVGFYGVPFLYSLYFQELRGLSSLGAGLAFVPMMAVGLVLTPLSARIVERTGPRLPITGGLALMTAGLVALSTLPHDVPIGVPSVLMVLVGLGGPLVMPPTIAVLLSAVPGDLAGTASGVLNTSRQVGGALAIAVFGSLVAGPGGLEDGLRWSLLLGSAVLLVATVASLRVASSRGSERRRWVVSRASADDRPPW
ncbi:MFS transporter [Marmoricola sp. Leaf446]|uniref:MFS transporter n=1 Tax=Marmoricola sp. Leaf446 TaxID=1736379 RepID=UPI0006F42325|nr:MFS transporter [Marmoricola sp. Leaf446]KQT94784.1 MFS transporter [Marmoricola sp. Leaf446]